MICGLLADYGRVENVVVTSWGGEIHGKVLHVKPIWRVVHHVGVGRAQSVNPDLQL